MPTDVIDLGYFGARYLMAPSPSDNDGFYSTPQACDAYALDLHKRIKYPMERENGGNNWSVGRLFKWSTGDYLSYGTVIKHLDGAGSPTGKEFLFVFSGMLVNTTSIARSAPNDAWQQTGASTEYMGSDFELMGGETLGGYMGLHYHKGGLLGASYTYNVGAGADLAAPTVSPRTSKVRDGVTGFMPNETNNLYPKGMAHTDYGVTLYFDQRQCLVFNWEKPFIGVYLGYKVNAALRRAIVVGDIYIPRDPTDTYTLGGILLDVVNGSGGSASHHAEERASFLQADGTYGVSYGNPSFPGTEGLVYPAYFTPQNQPRPDGTFDRERVKVMARAGTNAVVTYDKGYLDPDVCCMMGSPHGRNTQLFDTPIGKSLKVGGYLTLPWAAGYPHPFSGWPLNPQRKFIP